jgi:hypothetical protein
MVYGIVLPTLMDLNWSILMISSWFVSIVWFLGCTSSIHSFTWNWNTPFQPTIIHVGNTISAHVVMYSLWYNDHNKLGYHIFIHAWKVVYINVNIYNTTIFLQMNRQVRGSYKMLQAAQL